MEKNLAKTWILRYNKNVQRGNNKYELGDRHHSYQIVESDDFSTRFRVSFLRQIYDNLFLNSSFTTNLRHLLRHFEWIQMDADGSLMEPEGTKIGFLSENRIKENTL